MRLQLINYSIILLFINIHFSAGQEIQRLYVPQPFIPDSIVDESQAVYYEFKIGTTGSGCEVAGKVVELINDTIHVRTCAAYGNFGQPCIASDKAFIGQLDPGIYHLVHASFAKSYPIGNDSLCFDNPRPSKQWDTVRYVLTVLPTTSTVELTQNHPSLQVWPNPADNQLTISGWEQREGWLKLYDSQGRLVHNRWIEREMQTVDVPVLGLSPGVYLVRFQDRGGGSTSTRVIVY